MLHIDLEAWYAHTDAFVTRIMTRPDVRPHWVCLPIHLRNSVSQLQPHWLCWDPDAKDLWVRELPAHPRLALVNSVADTYFELKYLDESIKVMDASVKRYQELLRLIEAKYEFGKVASVEPLQAQQSLLSARNSLLDLEDRQNVARQTLRA